MFTEKQLYRLIQIVAASDAPLPERQEFFDTIMRELKYYKQEEPLDNFVSGNTPKGNAS